MPKICSMRSVSRRSEPTRVGKWRSSPTLMLAPWLLVAPCTSGCGPTPDTARGHGGAGGAGGGVPAELHLAEVSCGARHACVRVNDGRAFCWGSNEHHELGTGELELVGAPGVVLGLDDARAISASDLFTCALRPSGRVSCWGANNLGQLGDGYGDWWSTPHDVVQIAGADQLSRGSGAYFATRVNEAVYWWGLIPGPAFYATAVPEPAPSFDGASEIATGFRTMCAVVGAGSVECIGNGESGQLGNGANQDQYDAAVQVLGIATATKVAAGTTHACAITSKSEVLCWGSNERGELGNGVDTNAASPVPAIIPVGVVDIAAGIEYTCALSIAGKVFCWGRNDVGQLGDGTVVDRATPAEVVGLDDVISLSAGDLFACAVRKDDSVWCWGGNGWGELAADPVVVNPNGELEIYGSAVPVRITQIDALLHP